MLVLALLLLDPKRLPGAARSLGQRMREFKDAITGRGSQPHDDASAILAPADLRGLDDAEERAGGRR